MSLLKALAPRAPSPLGYSDRFGAVGIAAILATIAKGATAATASAKAGKSLSRHLGSEKKKLDLYRERYESSKKRLDRAVTPAAKRRALRSMLRYKELLEIGLLKQSLARTGRYPDPMLLDGAAIEARRNMLSSEWSSSSAERRKHIEALVKSYDERLVRLERRARSVFSGSRSVPPQLIRRTLRDNIRTPPPDAVQQDEDAQEAARSAALLQQGIAAQNPAINIDKALTEGMGGMMSVAKAPPGPGQQVRVSFYPTNPAQSFSGANGIVVPGDDPVVQLGGNMTPAADIHRFPEVEITTEMIDYGSYRLLGIQSHLQNNYQVRIAAGTQRAVSIRGVGITIRSIQVYNGQELLLPNLGELDVQSFNVMPTAEFVRGVNQPAAVPLTQGVWQTKFNQGRSDRFFVGLRTNPVIEGTARIRAVISAYMYTEGGVIQPGDTTSIPVTLSIIGQMLEDKVYGNPVVVGPAARAGAQVNVGLRDEGLNAQGVRQYRLRNPRYVTPDGSG